MTICLKMKETAWSENSLRSAKSPKTRGVITLSKPAENTTGLVCWFAFPPRTPFIRWHNRKCESAQILPFTICGFFSPTGNLLVFKNANPFRSKDLSYDRMNQCRKGGRGVHAHTIKYLLTFLASHLFKISAFSHEKQDSISTHSAQQSLTPKTLLYFV